MDISGALAFDHRGIVVGNAQRHFAAELAAQIIDERRKAVDDSAGVLGRNDGVDQLGILRVPALCAPRPDWDGCGSSKDGQWRTPAYRHLSPLMASYRIA